MDDYRVYINGQDKTGQVGNVQLEDNLDNFARSLTFSLLSQPQDPQIKLTTVEPGDKVQFSNNGQELYRGIVTKVAIDGSVTSYDYGFYLQKSDVVYQCNGVGAADAIRQLCQKQQIPVKELPSLGTKITEVYVSKKVGDVMRDILEKVTNETGISYFIRIEPEGLVVRKKGWKMVWTTYTQTEGAKPVNPTWTLGELTGEKSIEEMSNRVVVAKEEEEKAYLMASAEDGESIKKYGLIQTTITPDEDTDTPKAQNMARQKLKELNRVKKTFSVPKMFGTDVISAGVLMDFSSTAYGFAGDFLLKAVTHSYAPTHTVSVEVEEYEQ